MIQWSQIKGLLIDLDGVIYEDNELIPGADDLINLLNEKNIRFRFLTNTTAKTRQQIRDTLARLGIATDEDKIYSALYAAEKFLLTQEYSNVFPLMKDKIIESFPIGFDESRKVEAVLVTDMEHGFTFDILNRAFNYVLEGAELIAAHKNRYWKKNRKLQLDAGAFVALLEYAAGTTARLIGKPNQAFFQLALDDLQLSREEVLMIGDDVITDVRGAADFDMDCLLVRTGKYRKNDENSGEHKPVMVIDSVADVIDLLNL